MKEFIMAIAKKVTKDTRVFWRKSDREAVFMFLEAKGITSETPTFVFRDGILKAIAMKNVPDRPMGYSALYNERARYVAWLEKRQSESTDKSKKPSPALSQTSAVESKSVSGIPSRSKSPSTAPTSEVNPTFFERAKPSPQPMVDPFIAPRAPLVTVSTKPYAKAFSEAVQRPGKVEVVHYATSESKTEPRPVLKVSKEPSTPPLTTGDIEAIVRKVMDEEKKNILASVKTLLGEHQIHLQLAFEELHNSLMSYWEPDQAAFLGKTENLSGSSSVLAEEAIEKTNQKSGKTKAKRVLVVSNNERRLAPLRDQFKELDFTFAIGNNPKGPGLTGEYDAVLCTRFVSHSVSANLRRQYPGKVFYATGPGTSLERVIRENIVKTVEKK
jgi:hypothetical protein